MRLIPEVEVYAEGLRKIDERIADAPSEGTRESVDRIERELAALRDRFLCEGAPTRGVGEPLHAAATTTPAVMVPMSTPASTSKG